MTKSTNAITIGNTTYTFVDQVRVIDIAPSWYGSSATLELMNGDEVLTTIVVGGSSPSTNKVEREFDRIGWAVPANLMEHLEYDEAMEQLADGMSEEDLYEQEKENFIEYLNDAINDGEFKILGGKPFYYGEYYNPRARAGDRYQELLITEEDMGEMRQDHALEQYAKNAPQLFVGEHDAELFLFERVNHAADDCNDIWEQKVLSVKVITDDIRFYTTLEQVQPYDGSTEWRVCRYITNGDDGEPQDQGTVVRTIEEVEQQVARSNADEALEYITA